MALVESAEGGIVASQRGATLVRLRAPRLSVREQERELRQLVAAVAVPVIATSRVDLALAAGAQGIHLVEGDISVGDARALGSDLIVGRSVHSVEGVVEAAADRPDYLLLGPIWATPSHPESRGLGLDVLRAAALAARPVPIVAVGGVDEARTERVMRAGAAGWAAIRMYK
jgi:thiamine-phosphate pyrophosphorylase